MLYIHYIPIILPCSTIYQVPGYLVILLQNLITTKQFSQEKDKTLLRLFKTNNHNSPTS